MAIKIIAELATNHGGNLDIAKRMIDDAAAAGADMVKTQAYDLEKLNPNDPQADWLRQAHLSREAHVALKSHASASGVQYFASAFDYHSATFIASLCGAVKFASSVPIYAGMDVECFKSHPWRVPEIPMGYHALVTVPLYPAPLECVGRVSFDDAEGWSDHCVSLSGCAYALAHGMTILEVHMTTNYAERQCAWDKTPEQIRELRQLCDDMETIRSGVSQQFRERWTA